MATNWNHGTLLGGHNLTDPLMTRERVDQPVPKYG